MRVLHTIGMEEFAITLIDGLELLAIASEETLDIVGYEGFVKRHLLYLSVVVATFLVDVPAPILQEAYIKGIGRTEEGAAHTHQTVVVEMELALLVLVDVLRGTALDAQSTIGTLVGIHMIEERIDIATNVLRTGHGGHHETRPASVGLEVGNAILDLIQHDLEQLLVHLQHLTDAVILEREMNVVGHHEVVLVLDDALVLSEFTQNVLRTGIVGMIGLATILIYKYARARGKLLLTDELQEGVGRREAIDGTAQTNQVVRGIVQRLDVERINLVGRHRPTFGLHAQTNFLGNVARVEGACIV